MGGGEVNKGPVNSVEEMEEVKEAKKREVFVVESREKSSAILMKAKSRKEPSLSPTLQHYSGWK